MIELESESASGALAARGENDGSVIGGTGSSILNQTFLCKKMEISFTLLASTSTDDAGGPAPSVGYLVLQDESSGTDTDTVAEAFNGALENKPVHESIIWARIFHFTQGLIDDADNIAYRAEHATFQTTKSFPKGFPFDKTKTYQWKVFNPSAATAWSAGTIWFMRMRAWGIYI